MGRARKRSGDRRHSLGWASSLLLILALLTAFVAGPATAGTTTYTYDVLGRVTSATYANGTTLSYTYDAAGNRTQLVTNGALAITTANVPTPVLNTPYSATVVVAGGTAPYTFSASGLPAGLGLNASTGVISGTPTASGGYTIVITVTDARLITASATYTGTIATLPVISPLTISTPILNHPYSASISASGGTAPLALAATGLPAGLTFTPGTGLISGTATLAGAYAITVTATDSHSLVGSRTYTGTIAGIPVVSPSTIATPVYSKAYGPVTVSATGGTAPLTLAASGLPSGMTFNASTGALGGTPGVSGSYAIVVTATDANGLVGSANYSGTINAPPVVSPSTIAVPVFSHAYGPVTISATGGTGAITLSASGLPAGMTFSAATGALGGTPSVTGGYAIVISATDANGVVGLTTYSGTIAAVPVVAPSTIATPVFSHAYGPVTVSATGGTAPLTLAASGLPAGMTFNAATGALGGTPSTAGAYAITVTATDANGLVGTAHFNGTINGPPSVSPTSIATPVFSRAYGPVTVSATGGTAPLTLAAAGLPAGMTFNASTGALGGTPSAAGAYAITVTATDVNGLTGSQTYSGTITPPPSITTASVATPVIGVAYSQTISASGGTGADTFSISAGALPTGLSISAAGIISGTPSAGGSFPFTVTATDANGLTGAKAYTATVTFPNGAVIFGSSTPGSFAFTVTGADLAFVGVTTTGGDGGNNTTGGNGGQGGTATSYFAVSPGDVISGSIGASGTPVSVGTAPSGGNSTTTSAAHGISQTGNGGAGGGHPTPGAGGAASGGNVSNVTGQTGVASGSNGNVTIETFSTIPNPPTITTASISTPVITRPYSQTISASGGTPGYSFSISSGTLPTGLSLSPSGLISGTPSAAGTFSFVVLVVDSNHFTGSASYSVTVGGPPSISTASITTPVITRPYSQTINATGGTPAYSFSIAVGALPAGLTLSSAGVISGTPSAIGAYNFTVMVTDANSLTASATYAGTINGPPSITTASVATPVISTAYSQTISATGGTGPYSFSVSSGALPPLLSISTAGIISGTPNAAGVYHFTITVTDANGLTASQAYATTVAYVSGTVIFTSQATTASGPISGSYTFPSNALPFATIAIQGADGGDNSFGVGTFGGSAGATVEKITVNPGVTTISWTLGSPGGNVVSGTAPQGGGATASSTNSTSPTSFSMVVTGGLGGNNTKNGMGGTVTTAGNLSATPGGQGLSGGQGGNITIITLAN
jgi:large repetitive protein